MKQLYILRHGQSEANAAHKVAGSIDSPLSPLGSLQAQLAGQTAKDFFNFDLLVSSPMKRALQTAQIIAKQLEYDQEKVLILQDLRERNLGAREGARIISPLYDNNVENAESAPGVEPLEDLYARATQSLKIIKERPEQTVLIVCHNGLGRMLRLVEHGGQAKNFYEEDRLDNAIIYPL